MGKWGQEATFAEGQGLALRYFVSVLSSQNTSARQGLVP